MDWVEVLQIDMIIQLSSFILRKAWLGIAVKYFVNIKKKAFEKRRWSILKNIDCLICDYCWLMFWFVFITIVYLENVNVVKLSSEENWCQESADFVINMLPVNPVCASNSHFLAFPHTSSFIRMCLSHVYAYHTHFVFNIVNNPNVVLLSLWLSLSICLWCLPTMHILFVL